MPEKQAKSFVVVNEQLLEDLYEVAQHAGMRIDFFTKARQVLVDHRGKPKDKRLCQDWSEIGNYLSDAYDANIDVLSTSQRALITLMQQGGSWADRVYDAMFDVIDPLLKRIVRPPAED